MWYMFIPPAAIERSCPASFATGDRSAPGCAWSIAGSRLRPEGKRPPKPVVATIYLAFDDEARQVWADLRVLALPDG